MWVLVIAQVVLLVMGVLHVTQHSTRVVDRTDLALTWMHGSVQRISASALRFTPIDDGDILMAIDAGAPQIMAQTTGICHVSLCFRSPDTNEVLLLDSAVPRGARVVPVQKLIDDPLRTHLFIRHLNFVTEDQRRRLRQFIADATHSEFASGFLEHASVHLTGPRLAALPFARLHGVLGRDQVPSAPYDAVCDDTTIQKTRRYCGQMVVEAYLDSGIWERTASSDMNHPADFAAPNDLLPWSLKSQAFSSDRLWRVW